MQGDTCTMGQAVLPPSPLPPAGTNNTLPLTHSDTQTAQSELRTTRNELGQELVTHAAAERQLKADLESALDQERDGFMTK